MSSISIEDFNKTVNGLIKNYKYNEAADYLSSVVVTDKDKQIKLTQDIASLRQQGRMFDALMTNATSSQKDVIKFYNAAMNGTTISSKNEDGTENSWAKRYNGLLQAIGNGYGWQKDDSKVADSLSIKFEGKTVKRYGLFGIDWLSADDHYADTGYDLFRQQMGISSNEEVAALQLQRLGITKSTDDDGNVVIDFSKSNEHFNDIIRGLRGVDTNHSLKHGKDPIQENYSGTARYSVAGKRNGQLLENPQRGEINYQAFAATELSDSENLFSTSARNVDLDPHYANPSYHGQYGSSSWFAHSQIFEINRMLDDAEDVMKSIIPNGEEDQGFLRSTRVYDVTGAAVSNLRQKLNNGEIDTEEYNRQVKIVNGIYESTILNTDYTQEKMYGFPEDYDPEDTDKDIGLQEYDTRSRRLAGEEIKAAFDDGRLSIGLGFSGNELGAYLTILPKKDNKDKFISHEKVYFVPTMFQDKAKEAIKEDTDFRAAVEANNMELYNYKFDVSDSDTKKYVAVNGAPGEAYASLIEGEGDGTVITPITKEEMQRQINKKFMIDDLINMARMGNYTEDGEFRIDPNMEARVDAVLTSMISALYPQTMSRINSESKTGLSTTTDSEFIKNKFAQLRAYIKSQISAFNN